MKRTFRAVPKSTSSNVQASYPYHKVLDHYYQADVANDWDESNRHYYTVTMTYGRGGLVAIDSEHAKLTMFEYFKNVICADPELFFNDIEFTVEDEGPVDEVDAEINRKLLEDE